MKEFVCLGCGVKHKTGDDTLFVFCGFCDERMSLLRTDKMREVLAKFKLSSTTQIRLGGNKKLG